MSCLILVLSLCLSSPDEPRTTAATPEKPKDKDVLIMTSESGKDLYRFTPSVLLRQPPVRKEIKVTPEQTDALTRYEKEVADAWIKRALPRLKRPDGYDDEAANAEREAREVVEANQREIRAYQRILSPAQYRRLRQIYLHLAGPLALSDPAFADLVNLSPDQRDRILAIRQQVDQLQNQVMQQEVALDSALTQAKNGRVSPQDDEAFRRKNANVYAKNFQTKTKARELACREILRSMTKRQRETFQKALGPPFELGAMAEPGADSAILVDRPKGAVVPAGSVPVPDAKEKSTEAKDRAGVPKP